jgi:lipoyl(octanoyl) transferase
MNNVEWITSNGLIPYNKAINVMEQKVIDIYNKKDKELIWLLEHPPIYTKGVSGKDSDLLEARFPIYETNRGGQYTYHGPGQRVIYVMMDLQMRCTNNKPDIRKFVYSLEQSIIDTLLDFDIIGERREGRIGIWVSTKEGEKKIASIGIKLKKWVSYHGVAININPDLDHFSGIIPCGINNYGVTSMAALGKKADFKQFDQVFRQRFDRIFAY